MFAGNDENRWLDQIEEEFGRDLSDHEEEDVKGSRTTIELDVDAKESLAKEMKEKDYDLEGIALCSSKKTHRENMTGKTGMTLACSVTNKKFAIPFKQQKTNVRAERKQTALLEQRLWEMEAALAAGTIPIPPSPSNLIFSITSKTDSMIAPTATQDAHLAKKFDSQLILPCQCKQQLQG
jgi:hypothetical protein